MVSSESLVQVAQSATNNKPFLAAISEAYTEAGNNVLEQFILDNLPLDEQPGDQDGSDIVSDFFTVFG